MSVAPETGVADGLPPAVVLIASDRMIERDILASQLREAGLTPLVTAVSDAFEAIEAAAERNAPVIKLVIEGNEDPATAGRLFARAQALAQSATVRGLVLVSPLARSGLDAGRGTEDVRGNAGHPTG